MLGLPNSPAEGSQPKLVVMKVLWKLLMNEISHPHVFVRFTLSLSVFPWTCSFIYTFARSFLLFLHGDALHACTQRGCQTLSMSLPQCQTKYIQNSRETERQGWWPISFHPLVFLLLFLFSSLALLFLITAPKSLSAGPRLWQTLFSIGPGRFPGHFSGDDECSSLSSTLFPCQTVYSIPNSNELSLFS